MKIQLNKRLIIIGAVVFIGLASTGAYAMSSNSNDENKQPKSSSFESHIEKPEGGEKSVEEKDVTSPAESKKTGSNAQPSQPQAAVVDPSVTASQTFVNGTGTITISVNSGTADLAEISASVGGANIGATTITASGSVSFMYQSADGNAYDYVVVTIYDKSGKKYESSIKI